jgi:cyclopropane-fatty-acyl-phospholipid synthase
MKNAIKDIAQAMHKSVPEASFAVRFWDQDLYSIGDTPAFTLWFKQEAAASRVLADGFMGFGEAFMDGSIEVDGDLQLLFRLGFAVGYTQHSMSLGLKIRLAVLYYATPDDSLDQAQTNKFDLVCRKLRLQKGEHMADLGCGWGGLLIHAAQNYGVTGVGVTLSESQHEYGVQKIKELGLQDQIEIQLKDYREIEGSYDKLATIGMMEHVGIRFVPGCFAKIQSILKPGGIGLVHTIGNDVLHKPDPWTDKYIFPGAQVPTLTMLVESAAKVGMNVVDVENLRLHYEKTIFDWLELYYQNKDWICETYDEPFYRSYQLYLEVSAASFRYGDNRLFQVLFTNGLSDLVPLTRDDLYRA